MNQGWTILMGMIFYFCKCVFRRDATFHLYDPIFVPEIDRFCHRIGGVWQITAFLANQWFGYWSSDHWFLRKRNFRSSKSSIIWTTHKCDIQELMCVLTLLKKVGKQRNGGNWFSNPTPELALLYLPWLNNNAPMIERVCSGIRHWLMSRVWGSIQGPFVLQLWV